MAINLALTLTLDGRDAFWNSGNTGTKLDITHLQFGTRNRLPTGEESLLSLPKQSVKIKNGNKIGPDQVRIMATMPGIENYNVTEIGLWSGEPGIVGSILVAYTSVRTGYIAQMVNGIDLVFTYDMVIATTDIDKINIVKDTDQSSTFSLLAEHETDRNAHPFYVTTDTAQTISGAKTFTNKAIFSGGLTGELTGNAATATQLKTPRTVSFSGAATGSFSFDGSQDASGVLTLANSGVVAGTYGTLLKIPVITANIKGLITGLSEQQIPVVDDLVTGGATKLLSAEQGKKLQANKVEKTKSFNDAFGSDIDHYLPPHALAGFTSCADFPVGSRVLLDSASAFPDIPSIDGHVYIETKRTYMTPGKLQIAYGYYNARIATRAAGTGGPYSEWRYMASLDSNVASATKLQTPRTISLIGDGAGSASFDGSANASINLTLNDVNNSAGTYGANNLEIPTFTLNKKGLLTSAGNRAFPYAGVGQYGAAILYDGLDSHSTSHSATANIVRHLNAVKVDINKSFNDAFGSDVDNYISPGNLKGFTSCADFPVGSRMIVDAPALPDMPSLGSAAVYFETKRTYTAPGKLQIAYGYNNGRTATRSAGTNGGYSDWVYTADTSSISRYRQDLDATRIYSPGFSKLLSITDNAVQAHNLEIVNSIFAKTFKSPEPFYFLGLQDQEQSIMTGGLLASNAYSDLDKLPQWGIWAKGVIESAAGFKGKLLSKDSRIFKPYHAENGGISSYFVTEWGLNNDYVGGNYGDFLSLNTYHDASAGMQNGLFFDKTHKRILHYQSEFGAANWGAFKRLAYVEDVLSTNGGTMNAPINFNLSHADGAFHKLIEGTTVTDGGYIAVGNHGSDKGYLELGTTDDADAAIYARKRNAVNTCLEEAVILGPDGNTSFPHSVFIHNALGGYGKNGLVKGNGDNAAYAECNIDITSWFGVGIKASNSGERTVVFNARTGDISNRGSLHTEQWVNAKGLGVNNTEGIGHGLSLHGGTAGGMPNYGISFAQTYNYGTCGYVNGDWATYFTMTGAYNRGWIFRSFDYGNVASISSQGLLSIPTMRMDRSNFQIEHYSTFSIYYDFATRIVRIVMKVQSAAGIGTADSPFKFVDNRYTAKFSLPITLQLRLSAEFHFNNVGPGYTPWHEEAAEWHTWCAPVGLRGSTESAVTVDIMRWTGSKGEAIDGYLIVTGFF